MTQEPMPTDLEYPESKAFIEEYVRRHGAPPSSPWPVYAADAFKVICAAIEATGSTNSETLMNYLHDGLKDYPGITGPISFDANGDREGAIYLAYEVFGEGDFRPRR